MSIKTLLCGVAPKVDDRNKLPIKSTEMWKLPLWTPCNRRGMSDTNKNQLSDMIPCRRVSAAWSGFTPPSDSSILRVILGFVLFSSTYPGLYMVPGKKIWISIK